MGLSKPQKATKHSQTAVFSQLLGLFWLSLKARGWLLWLLLALILLLAKVLLTILLLGLSARRRGRLGKGLELFGPLGAASIT